MSDFGDWEPADSFSPDNVPDSYYVTKRLHEIILFLTAPGSEWEDEWVNMDPDEKEVALALGEVLTTHIIEQGRDGAAIALHEARRFLSEQPTWDELEADEQEFALALADDIVRWLELEGTVIR